MNVVLDLRSVGRNQDAETKYVGVIVTVPYLERLQYLGRQFQRTSVVPVFSPGYGEVVEPP